MTISILIVLCILMVFKPHVDECNGGVGSILFALLGIFFLTSLFLLEYFLYFCYIVEIIIIPYEKDALLYYEEAMKDICKQLPMKKLPNSSRETERRFSVVNGVSQRTNNNLPNRFHCYQRCVVIAVHVKATETFPDVGAVDHVSNILEYIYSLFDECIDKFGIIGKQTHSLLGDMS
jgi:hypothetical protein